MVAILPQPDNALEESVCQTIRPKPGQSQSCLSRTMLQRCESRAQGLVRKEVAILPQPDNALEVIMMWIGGAFKTVAILPQPDNALEDGNWYAHGYFKRVAILPQPDNALEKNHSQHPEK